MSHRYRGAVDANRRLAWGGAGLLTGVVGFVAGMLLTSGGLVGLFRDSDKVTFLQTMVTAVAMGGVVGAMVGLFIRNLRPAAAGYLLGVTPVVLFIVVLASR